MFKFDFQVEGENDSAFPKAQELLEASSKDGEVNNKVYSTDEKLEIDWFAASNVSIPANALENLDVYKLNSTTLQIGEVAIEHVVTGFLLEHITANTDESQHIAKAEETHSDLIPGIYEGGAKVWECTRDLLEYLAVNFGTVHFEGKNVLDLGCGAGLLGIYAYKCGSTVHFQDYNKDVLTQITIPNLLLNASQASASTDDATDTDSDVSFNVDMELLHTRVQFYAGDWQKYAILSADDVDAEKFDFILTSETIYNPANQQKLLDTLHAKLRPSGVVLVAAKTYYFGVGGGLRQFEALVEKDNRFTCKVLWTLTDGVGREILELKLL